MRRNEAYSDLVADMFPHHIRLSIHSHSNVSKFGINLVGKGKWGTPWHNVPVLMKDNTWQLMKRSQAEASGYQLISLDGDLRHYKEC